MFVRADWTRRGLGRRIIEECEAAARREGFRQLALVATLPGLPLYLACGFERREELEVTMPDGVVSPASRWRSRSPEPRTTARVTRASRSRSPVSAAARSWLASRGA